MYFEKVNKQWLLEIHEAYSIVGTNLAKKVIHEGIHVIGSGQILVFDKLDICDKVVFQTLENIDLLSVRPNNLVGYEPGSVVSLRYRKQPRVIPTFIFRNCRFPTASEYTDYERINNL